MPIDIDQLNESELIDLNHRIVTRLRFLREMRAHASMLEFSIGERVKFYPQGQAPVTGVVTRYNKKTVTVVAEGGFLWRVAPQLLERAPTVGSPGSASDNVIALPLLDGHPRK